ncbi:MAG: translation elongation factor Ts [Gemmataceae bacterium]
MEVNAADVKKLRDRTGMQMMKCKAALIEAGGDMDKATEILRKQNKDVAAKVTDRETAEGRISVFIDAQAKIGTIVEVRCESAPVAKNEIFVKLANSIAEHLARNPSLASPADLQTQMTAPIQDVVGLMRENIKVQRMAILHGLLGQYIHHDGTVGVLLSVDGATGDTQMLRDVCMHVAAKNPLAATRDQIPQAVVEKEREIAVAQAQEQGKNKPANIIEKIAEGKLNAWFKDQVLSEQPFVKDESKTVAELLKSGGMTLKGFVRYKVGEVTA